VRIVRTLRARSELSFGHCGGAECFFHDIDGDGLVEVVTYQGPGIFGAENLKSLPKLAYVRDFYPRSVSVSAFRMDGARLWTWGTPNPPDPPFVSHAAECVIACADVDGDGAVEVALADGARVVVLDGRTGALKKTADLPSDNFYVIGALGAPAGRAPRPQDATLVVKNSEIGYGQYDYGEPVIGLNADLEVAWGPTRLSGGGHYVLAVDPGGDRPGYYLNGYAAVAPDGEILWTVDGIDLDAIDTAEMHVDLTDVLVRPDGTRLFAIAGSDNAYVVEEGGRLLVSRTGSHVQSVALGRFRTSSEHHLAVYNSPDGPMQLYDLAGNHLWDRPTPRTWPLGMPRSCRDGRFHRNRPIVTLPGERDRIAYTDGGWPWGMDGEGEISLRFEPPANSKQPESSVTLPKGTRRDDMGYGFGLQVCDADSDGRPEALIYDRRFLWVYPLG